jgi:type 1 fimbriae regulatory protein FimB
LFTTYGGELVTECTLSKESESEAVVATDTCSLPTENADSRKVKSQVVDDRAKDFLTVAEMHEFLGAAKLGRHGARDYAMMLLCYRHGLRVSELIDIRLGDIDLATSRLYVRRLKGSLSTSQPIEGDELRSLRSWLRERSLDCNAAHSPYLFLSERGPMTRQALNYLVGQIARRAKLGFKVNPHMLRHSCGFYLANKGLDTRLIQDYLGHRNISHTTRYTRTAASRFEGLWR